MLGIRDVTTSKTYGPCTYKAYSRNNQQAAITSAKCMAEETQEV